MDVSVVIPTFNRKHLLARSVPRYINQKSGAFKYEVIFVINGSSDGSEDFLKDVSAQYPEKIRYYYIQPSGSPAAPRNVGIRASKGNVILILDDDVIPDDELIFHHAEFHRVHPEQKYAALGELYIPAELLEDPVSLFHDMIPFDQVRQLDRLSYLDFWTCNVSVKRQFMLDCGMFDESLPYYEDVDCGYRLAAHGMELRFVSKARGQHLHQLRLKDVAEKGRMIGRGLHEFELRVPDRTLRERHGILSWDLRPRVLVRRLINRAGMLALGNPLSLAALGFVAKRCSRRSRFTDLYYYVLFRKNMLAGYRAAKRC
jgi:glycosyltransferase involved in cell wall biosynthesis